MNKSVLRKIIAVVLCICMIAVSFASCTTKKNDDTAPEDESREQETYSFTTKTENVKKAETVYINLDSNGNQKQITVSDWLHADRSQVQVLDTTTLKNFKVTKGSASSVGDNGNIVWQMNSSDVYYQGSDSRPLPVNVSYTYTLNGAKIDPSNLKGKSGKVELTVKAQNMISKDVTVDGKKIKMYTPMLVIGLMILPYDNFNNISVTNGLSVGMGSSEIALFVGAPGLSESVGLDSLKLDELSDFSLSDTFTMTADATDFAMGDTYVVAMPLTSINLDINLPKSLDDVKNILQKLGNMENVLNEIDPDRLLSGFVTDGKSINEAIKMLKDATKLYKDNEKLLSTFSSLLTPENLKTLSSLSEMLNSSDMKTLTSLLQNVGQLKSIMKLLGNVSDKLEEAKPLLDELTKSLDDPEVQKQLENLPETMEQLSKMTEFLNKNEALLTVLSKLMSNENTKELTDALDKMLSDASNGNTQIDLGGINSDQLVKRMNEWLKFDYRLYTSAPETMDTSCMLVFKTDPIR